MFVGKFDPIGIGQTASIVVAVALVILALAWWWFVRDDFDYNADMWDSDQQLGSGVVLAQYLRAEDLTSVAVQRRIIPSAAWIERGQSGKTAIEMTGGSKRFGGRASQERGKEAKEHVEMPLSQPGDLIPKVLDRLNEQGELRTHLAAAPFTQADLRTVVSSPDEATVYVNEWMDRQYPDGIDDSPSDMAKGIVLALHRKAREDEIEQKRQEFKATGQDEFVLIESKWRVAAAGGGVQLWLQEWALDGRQWPPYERPTEPPVLALPSGVAIRATLDDGSMTDRGRRELTNGEIRKLGVFGTVQSYAEMAGRLEILPIAVFSRVGK